MVAVVPLGLSATTRQRYVPERQAAFGCSAARRPAATGTLQVPPGPRSSTRRELHPAGNCQESVAGALSAALLAGASVFIVVPVAAAAGRPMCKDVFALTVPPETVRAERSLNLST